MGKTNPEEAACGTIRADYAISMRYNSVHGGNGPESAAREINSSSQNLKFAPRPAE